MMFMLPFASDFLLIVSLADFLTLKKYEFYVGGLRT